MAYLIGKGKYQDRIRYYFGLLSPNNNDISNYCNHPTSDELFINDYLNIFRSIMGIYSALYNTSNHFRTRTPRLASWEDGLRTIRETQGLGRCWGRAQETLELISNVVSLEAANTDTIETRDQLRKSVEALLDGVLEILPAYLSWAPVAVFAGNQGVINFLQQRGNVYRAMGNPKLYAYDRVVTNLAAYNQQVTAENCKYIKGVGPKISKHIQNFLNGNIPEPDDQVLPIVAETRPLEPEPEPVLPMVAETQPPEPEPEQTIGFAGSLSDDLDSETMRAEEVAKKFEQEAIVAATGVEPTVEEQLLVIDQDIQEQPALLAEQLLNDNQDMQDQVEDSKIVTVHGVCTCPKDRAMHQELAEILRVRFGIILDIKYSDAQEQDQQPEPQQDQSPAVQEQQPEPQQDQQPEPQQDQQPEPQQDQQPEPQQEQQPEPQQDQQPEPQQEQQPEPQPDQQQEHIAFINVQMPPLHRERNRGLAEYLWQNSNEYYNTGYKCLAWSWRRAAISVCTCNYIIKHFSDTIGFPECSLRLQYIGEKMGDVIREFYQFYEKPALPTLPNNCPRSSLTGLPKVRQQFIIDTLWSAGYTHAAVQTHQSNGYPSLKSHFQELHGYCSEMLALFYHAEGNTPIARNWTNQKLVDWLWSNGGQTPAFYSAARTVANKTSYVAITDLAAVKNIGAYARQKAEKEVFGLFNLKRYREVCQEAARKRQKVH